MWDDQTGTLEGVSRLSNLGREVYSANPSDILSYSHAIRHLVNHERFHFGSITARECLEDTYIYMLRKTGLDKYLRWKLIIFLIKRENIFDKVYKMVKYRFNQLRG